MGSRRIGRAQGVKSARPSNTSEGRGFLEGGSEGIYGKYVAKGSPLF